MAVYHGRWSRREALRAFLLVAATIVQYQSYSIDVVVIFVVAIRRREEGATSGVQGADAWALPPLTLNKVEKFGVCSMGTSSNRCGPVTSK